MLLILRSIVLSSALIAASPSDDAPGAAVAPVAALPPDPDPAEPVVTPGPPFGPGPDEFAVPTLLVPSGGDELNLPELPAPLGSLPELLRPPALAGPDGTPLTPAVPAPAEPAFGEPAALPLVDEPPEVCAGAATGPARIAIAMSEAVTDSLAIGKLLWDSTTTDTAGSEPERFRADLIEFAATQEAGSPCAN
jgi:hypothetical protein